MTLTWTGPAGIRPGIVRGISYGLFGPPEEIVPTVRGLGGGVLRVYLYWQQLEPSRGVFDWTAFDALLAQLDGTQEIWLTICSSSRWATQRSTDFLPPSPALDLHAYGRFVAAVVGRAAGRIAYWQCENEPTNAELWAGTPDEYAAQLEVFAREVRRGDPTAAVVLAGCGYDVYASPAGSAERAAFGRIVALAASDFDLFDAHLYGDPYLIPDRIEESRSMMRAHGYEKPVVAGEYNGPAPFDYPEAEAALYDVMVAMAGGGAGDGTPAADTAGTVASSWTPERRAMRALYDRMDELPERLRMFMSGCSADLRGRRERIACRELVMRNLLAASAGVRRMVCWNLAPEVPNGRDPLRIMELMFGTFTLLDHDENGALTRRFPIADTFQLLAGTLGAASEVRRLAGTAPEIYAFEIRRGERGRSLVVWERRDDPDADTPGRWIEAPWDAEEASPVDALGRVRDASVAGGVLRVAVSGTPVLVNPAG